MSDQIDLTKISAADFMQSFVDEEGNPVDLSQIDAASLIAALQEEPEEEKTASELVAELSDEDLAKLAEEDQDVYLALLGAVEEEEKVAALMSGAYDEDALRGQVMGTAHGEALVAELAAAGLVKQASASDVLESLTEEDLAEMPAADFLELAQAAEAEAASEKTAGEILSELTEEDLEQVPAADFLALVKQAEEEGALAPEDEEIDWDTVSAAELLAAVAEMDEEPEKVAGKRLQFMRELAGKAVKQPGKDVSKVRGTFAAWKKAPGEGRGKIRTGLKGVAKDREARAAAARLAGGAAAPVGATAGLAAIIKRRRNKRD